MKNNVVKKNRCFGDYLFFFNLIVFLALPNITFPGFAIIRGLLSIVFFSYMLLLYFRSDGRTKIWFQLVWLFSFLFLSNLSRQWAYYPNAIDELFSNMLWSFLLSCSISLYVQYCQCSVEKITKILVCIIPFLFGNIFLYGGFVEGRFTIGELNENQFGMITSGVSCFLFYLSKNRKWHNLILNVIFILLSLFTLLSGSRISFFSLGLYVIMILYFEYPSKNFFKFSGKLLQIISLVVVAFFCVLNIDFLYSSIGVRIEGLLDFWQNDSLNDGSAVTRSNMKLLAAEHFVQNPWLGIGLNNFKYATYYGTYAHSNYYELASGLGIVGVLLYYIPILKYLSLSYNLWKCKIKESVLPLVIIIVFFIGDVGTVSYFSYVSHIHLGVAIGLIYKLKNQTVVVSNKLSY